jgi:hypothetical protein
MGILMWGPFTEGDLSGAVEAQDQRDMQISTSTTDAEPEAKHIVGQPGW